MRLTRPDDNSSAFNSTQPAFAPAVVVMNKFEQRLSVLWAGVVRRLNRNGREGPSADQNEKQ
jgi:hypothetical protein